MTKTLFIGLDGATFTVINEMIRDLPDVGVTMPFLKQFIENGARAKLLSTPNPLTPPAWVSIMTGRTPGNHGVYDFIRAEEKAGDVYFTLYDARDIRTETIWSIASRQNCTVVALNFPFTAPPLPINGALIPGFVPWKHLRRNTTPGNLYDRLKEIPDFDPKELAWDFDREKQTLEVMTDEDLENWVRYHIPRDEQWFRIAEKLLKEDNPDLMAVLFDGVDKLQHQIWMFLDPALIPANPSPWQKRMRELCLEYFRKLDTYIQRLVELAGSEAQVFMASDHGFTATTEVVRINTFLHEKGYLVWKETDGSEASNRRESSWFANLDWDKTLAYCRTPSSNGITIRVAEKPGDPGVQPSEYEAFREKLICDLENFRDPNTGERIIQAIHKREDVYSGAAMHEAPDLTLVLRDYGFVSIKNYEPAVEPRETPGGTHHPDGIFLAGGYGIKSNYEGKRQNVVDVPAALLYSLGLSVPADFEGYVPEEFFTETHLDLKPIKIGASTVTGEEANTGTGDISEDEKQQIIAQLQMLGYME
ncbi:MULTISPECIES: alkaline phosphatase family protein [Fischerella]|uniref:alkaline phosphatase family protein n=2 Tax=Hapalosiphonaceae TaxID=1892263 RepID=UPI00071EC3DF|nr:MULTISPECIES: alkaline phosphatase family protein [Fischerella]BCX07978.1 MAG: nucleotide pyrophosphatase [Fischerella sp.]PLZ04777.1 nucleotide pyrophosphatase [Fischerella thermalis WC1110]PLZ10870.1 nucleotide pyrophosphatase [Fischerella thermalis WC119]PLZ27915.1 nucleotide pyrophosphatase [Fischerella thermalis WC341]PLZ28338.1 nucleotide pyrophosphatase [Fischerella thermalis WC559]